MKAIVVYESHWGNTAAIARAIAEGIGPDARALTTSEATADIVERADLVVAGAPLVSFSLPSESTIENMRTNRRKAFTAPDVSHPALRTWLDALPNGRGRAAAFETRFRLSPGSAAGTILRKLQRAGYRVEGKGQKFIVKGVSGPLVDGEIERAREWGAELARGA